MPDALAPQIRVHIHVCPIQRVPLGVVIVKVAAVSDAGVRVRPIRIRAQAHDQAGHRGDDLPPELHHNLPVREDALVVTQLSSVPDHALFDGRGEATLVQAHEVVDVRELCQAQPGLAAAGQKPFQLHLALTCTPAPQSANGVGPRRDSGTRSPHRWQRARLSGGRLR
jgi:hypothetical protein